ncbi:MAG: AcrR family transcriptional regulator [Oceanicoccus sp.]|jgi:AcrR family transcriptional regulator
MNNQVIPLTLKTEQKVLAGARQCFFQHGYKASNMTLISEYAGYSRATVHKYFKNKDDAFRQVFHQYQLKANNACQPILAQQLECWATIGLIMQTWLNPTFEEVSNQHILNDLKYHVQHVAQDIFSQARQDIENMLSDVLTKAEKEKTLSLEKTGIKPRKLAILILASLDGLRGHLEKEDLQQASQEILHVFKLACR